MTYPPIEGFMSVRILGTCSICKGRVVVPTVWWGIVAPDPKCESCGARPASHGPVIEMVPSYSYQTASITSAGTGAWHFDKESD